MKHPKNYKLAVVQTQPSTDVEKNLEQAVGLIHEAAENGAKLVCLPELFRSPYFCQTEDDKVFELAEPIPGPSTEVLKKVAKEKEVVIVASLFEKRAPGIYHNTVAILDADGSMSGTYRKMHIPDDPGYYEKYYFTPGDLGFQAFDTAVGKIGTLICWDQWFPEGARLTALSGAHLLIYPTAIGWHPEEKEEWGKSQADAWETVQRGHAIANGVYVAAINRCGFEKADTNEDRGIEFWGNSFVCDPHGVIKAKAGNKPETLYHQIDLTHLENIRRGWPFLRDRRIDAYEGIDKRFLDSQENRI